LLGGKEKMRAKAVFFWAARTHHRRQSFAQMEIMQGTFFWGAKPVYLLWRVHVDCVCFGFGKFPKPFGGST
jgi:hypothetical protein